MFAPSCSALRQLSRPKTRLHASSGPTLDGLWNHIKAALDRSALSVLHSAAAENLTLHSTYTGVPWHQTLPRHCADAEFPEAASAILVLFYPLSHGAGRNRLLENSVRGHIEPRNEDTVGGYYVGRQVRTTVWNGADRERQERLWSGVSVCA